MFVPDAEDPGSRFQGEPYFNMAPVAPAPAQFGLGYFGPPSVDPSPVAYGPCKPPPIYPVLLGPSLLSQIIEPSSESASRMVDGWPVFHPQFGYYLGLRPIDLQSFVPASFPYLPSPSYGECLFLSLSMPCLPLNITYTNLNSASFPGEPVEIPGNKSGECLAAHRKFMNWIHTVYYSSKSPETFVQAWQRALKDMKQAFGPPYLPTIFILNQFLAAVSVNPDTIPWVESLHFEKGSLPASILDEAFADFLEFEAYRLGNQQSPLSNLGTDVANVYQIENLAKHYCPFHLRLTMHPIEECFRNPQNTKRRRKWRRKQARMAAALEAENGGGYDWHVLLERLPAIRWDLISSVLVVKRLRLFVLMSGICVQSFILSFLMSTVDIFLPRCPLLPLQMFWTSPTFTPMNAWRIGYSSQINYFLHLSLFLFCHLLCNWFMKIFSIPKLLFYLWCSLHHPIHHACYNMYALFYISYS